MTKSYYHDDDDDDGVGMHMHNITDHVAYLEQSSQPPTPLVLPMQRLV